MPTPHQFSPRSLSRTQGCNGAKPTPIDAGTCSNGRAWMSLMNSEQIAVSEFMAFATKNYWDAGTIGPDIGDFYPGEKSYGERQSYPTKKVHTVLRTMPQESHNINIFEQAAHDVHDTHITVKKGGSNATVTHNYKNNTASDNVKNMTATKDDTKFAAVKRDRSDYPAAVEKRKDVIFIGGMILQKPHDARKQDAPMTFQDKTFSNERDQYNYNKTILYRTNSHVLSVANKGLLEDEVLNTTVIKHIKQHNSNGRVSNYTKSRYAGKKKFGHMPRVKLRRNLRQTNHSGRNVSYGQQRRAWIGKTASLVLKKDDTAVALQNQLDPWPAANEHFGEALQYPTKMPVKLEVKAEPGVVGFGQGMPALTGVNVISMSLYGGSRRYTIGALRNADLARQNFPGWRLRIYTEAPSNQPRYGLVPAEVIESLRQRSVEVFFVNTHEERVPPMGWRFLVADDMDVDRFIIRDADARLTERDAAAVQVWIVSGKPFNCIRDHPSHAGYAISGGLWGGKPAALRTVVRRSWRDLMARLRGNYLDDMRFLNHVIWPLVAHVAYCSDSVSCDAWEGAHPFPVPRFGYETVGQVTDERERGRQVDMQIIRKVGENPKCSPALSKHVFPQ